jgi:hypothetical protein
LHDALYAGNRELCFDHNIAGGIGIGSGGGDSGWVDFGKWLLGVDSFAPAATATATFLFDNG